MCSDFIFFVIQMFKKNCCRYREKPIVIAMETILVVTIETDTTGVTLGTETTGSATHSNLNHESPDITLAVQVSSNSKE